MTRLAPSPCPNCKRQIDAATCPDDDTARPDPGDWTVCFYCAAALVFDDELRLAFAPPEVEPPAQVQSYQNAVFNRLRQAR